MFDTNTARTVLILSGWLAIPAGLQADERVDFFERKIRPVLVEHCYECHSAEGANIEGGLRLDSRDAMRRGGDSGPAFQVEDVGGSLLISALRYESLEMPPDRKLPAEVIGDFEKWISGGAVDPRDEVSMPAEEVESGIDYAEGRKFWAFQVPKRHPLPEHSHGGWATSPIDDFVLAKLESAGVEPSSPARPEVLVRRLAYDLVGLPPSDDLRSIAANAESYAAVVDRLLASVAYGEHWARLWLDVARFAEDQAHIVGNNQALFFPNAYLYRDWVVQALNSDMPYGRFIQLQLAADQLTPENVEDDVALGFMGLGPKYYRRNSPEVMADEWEDRVDTLSRGLLGLTVACARCHDHKYDPIGTADYYALAGVFASVDMFNRPLDSDRKTKDDGQAQEPKDAMHILRDKEKPKDLAIMIRGDVNRSGPVVPRRFLTVLCSAEPERFHSGSGRMELARMIASDKNPLTARVIVNRVWGRLMGQPLVGTPSNFGQLGERPSHPELLDDLSVRFMDNGWSLKWLCREIVMSATYRQSSGETQRDGPSQTAQEPAGSERSGSTPAGVQVDPANRLLWRMNRKRLTVEQWRDGVLAATGRLDGAVGGSSVDPSDPDTRRRTFYSQSSRLKLLPMLALFDYPDPNAHSAQRTKTTTPSQKLFLLNSPFMVEQAKQLAIRLESESEEVSQQVEQAYQLLFSRAPSDRERLMGIDFIGVDAARLEEYVHALMVTNEMLFVD